MADKEMNVRPEKVAVVAEIRDRLEGANCALLLNFEGMTVELSADIRMKLREMNASMFICKNRLLGAAIKDEPYYEQWSGQLNSSSALVTGDGDAVAIAKMIDGMCGDNDGLAVKCAMLDRVGLDAEEFKHLASLPGRRELQGKLVATLAEPMRRLVGVLGQKNASIVYVIKAIQDKKEAA